MKKQMMVVMVVFLCLSVDGWAQGDVEEQAPSTQRQESPPAADQPEPTETPQDEAENGSIVGVPLWSLGRYNTDPQVAVQEIAPAIERGFLPVGLDVDLGREITVLFALNTSLTPVSELVIIEFNALETLNQDIQDVVELGFVPMGISHHDNGLFVLFANIPVRLEGWSIATIDHNLVNIQRTIDEQEEIGFSAWGISTHGGQTWILFIRRVGQDTFQERGIIQAYRNARGLYADGINRAITQNWYPSGLTIDDNEFIVQYYQ